MKHDAFSELHPTVSFLYFAFVFGFTMCVSAPLLQLLSLVGAVGAARTSVGKRAVGFCFKFALPMLFLAAIVNPAFNHAGVTLLCYFPNGNPLTAESLLYGLSSGVLLASVLIWFLTFHHVFTSDKWVYLFGRVFPSLSLLLSMTLRFVPRFKRQLELTASAREGMGESLTNGKLFSRLRAALTIFSNVVSRSLEDAVETADSMRSRGYGSGKRSAFSLYRFTERDKAALVGILLCGFFTLFVALAGGFAFRYFPSVRGVKMTSLGICASLSYAALCFFPTILNRKEAARWNNLRSKM